MSEKLRWSQFFRIDSDLSAPQHELHILDTLDQQIMIA